MQFNLKFPSNCFKILFALATIIIHTATLNAQLPQYGWANTVRALTSPYSITCSSVTHDIAIDASGNIYTIGDFDGSVDANSGSGTTTLAAQESGNRTFIIKTSAAGTLIWAKCFQGEGTANPRGIAVDANENVYLTGTFSETVDFNPGSGTFELTSVSNFDMYMAKLDASGNFVWAKKINAGSFVSPNKVAIDINGNPVFVGYFSGTCDFNPNVGASSLTGSSNSFILKLDASGNFVYVKHFAATSANSILSIQIDAAGDMFLGGYYSTTTDFDPNAGVTNLSVISFSRDAFFCKLSNEGNLIWAKGIGGANSDELRALDLDNNGNILVAGTFRNSVDFNPGSGSFVMQTSGSTLDDIFIAKYSPTGEFIWAEQVGSSAGNFTDENVNDLAVDPSGNVVLVGFYYDEIDFDPGDANFPLYTGGFRNSFVLSLNSIGAFNYAFDIGMDVDLAGSESEAIDIDANGNIYIGGYTEGTCDMNPNAGTNNIASEYNQAMLWKFSPPSSTAYFTMPDYTVCTGTNQLVSNNASLQTGWQWSSNGGVIADPTSANTSITFSQAGIYTLQLAVGSELGTTITTQTVTVSNAPSLSITASSEILCGGGSTNLTANFSNGSVQWSSGQSVTTIIVSPSTTTTYVATLTANNGCIATATQVVEVVTQANIQITASDNSICAGESVTLTASGGEFYAWSNGSSSTSITVSPSSTTTYTVSGIVGSCNGSDSQSIQVSSAPNITIQSPSTTVCNGNSITLTANGGSSYLWSTGQTTASITVSPTVNTTYTVTGTNSGGCQNTASRNITIGATPNVNVVASNVTPCPGTTITVTAVGGTTYVWATGQTTNAITVTPLVNTTYYATGTNAAGCSATDSLVIILDPVPSITITNASNSICAGSSVTLTATGGNSYAWNGGQTTAAITVTPANSTTYTVTGTNSFSCSATASRTITVNPIPNVAIESSSPAVCLGGSIDLSGTGAATYSWNTGATTAVITVSPTSATSYTVTGTTAAGCSNQASRLVNVQAAPQIVFSEFPAGFCLNSSSYQLDASPLGGIFSGPGISGDLFIPANAGEGTHEITYLLDDGVCAVDSSFEFLVEECVSVDALSSVEEVNIYPNPASDWFYVDGITGDSKLTILNIHGQIVHQIDYNLKTEKLNVSNLSSGIYFLQWSNDKEVKTKKFIINR
jgi:hypothetical protein